jgi:hypothetical protein
MASHGKFHPKYPFYPFIIAYFEHPSIKYPRAVQFVIDTGADRTCISPDWRYLLQIPDREFQKYHTPQVTIAGKVRVDCLTNCTISFNRYQPNNTRDVYRFANLCILFSRLKYGSLSSAIRYRRLLRNVGNIPSILGRDVLSKMSLGYCQTSEYLFVTDQCVRYYQALSVHFPKP